MDLLDMQVKNELELTPLRLIFGVIVFSLIAGGALLLVSEAARLDEKANAARAAQTNAVEQPYAK